ncbi:MAG: hypothetical protein P8J20_05325 [Novosphingobium sp.]|nr:hypothetical protein [Novosphingobium sp.]
MSASEPKVSDPAVGWADIACESSRFGVDAAAVVWRRCLRLAGCGEAARSEAMLMVAEKWYGHGAWAKALASGKLGRSPKVITASTVTYYGQWVRENRQRLAEKD